MKKAAYAEGQDDADETVDDFAAVLGLDFSVPVPGCDEYERRPLDPTATLAVRRSNWTRLPVGPMQSPWKM